MSRSPKYTTDMPARMTDKARAAVQGLIARYAHIEVLTPPRRREDLPFLISAAYVPAGGVRKAFGGFVSIPPGVNPQCAWLLFIDCSPFAEWAHKCLYYFVDDGGNVSEAHEDTYPPSQK